MYFVGEIEQKKNDVFKEHAVKINNFPNIPNFSVENLRGMG